MCELIEGEKYVDNITRKVLVKVLRGSVSSFWHICKGFIEEWYQPPAQFLDSENNEKVNAFVLTNLNPKCDFLCH